MKSFNYSWLITAAILFVGFFLLHKEIVDYGLAFFVAFPIATGFAIASLSKKHHYGTWVIFGVFIFFAFLLILGWEGMVCVLMTIPIYVPLALLGYWIGKQHFKRKAEQKKNGQVLTIAFPLIILLVLNSVERLLSSHPALVTVKTEVVLPYTSAQVFDCIKSMDSLTAEKPWLLKLGLPTPYKCVLEGDHVGAKRTCLFPNGNIVAEITKFDRGQLLQMKVVDYNLTGRKWFRFNDATYSFETAGNQTRITRVTTYSSILKPRIYWERLEKYGIDQEHRFVLESLKKNLQAKYGKPGM